MKTKPILIIAGEPYSIFFEIFFKTFKKKIYKNLKNPIILICSKQLLIKQMKSLNYNFKINDISLKQIKRIKINNEKINIMNVNLNLKKTYGKISSRSNAYIKKSCDLALYVIKKHGIKTLINGPISKKHFLEKKYPGMTEYFAARTKKKGQEVMLIYNKKLSVSPLTTHLSLKNIFKKISKKKLMHHIKKIDQFYKKYLKKKPKIAITGLNPHCETLSKFSEEEKILKPVIKIQKKMGINVFGPFPADTLFLSKNSKNYDVIIGMYHDQVLTPIKTIYGFNAINITIGLPFLRITPDHGPNNQMLGKNLSDPSSLIEAINFIKILRGN